MPPIRCISSFLMGTCFIFDENKKVLLQWGSSKKFATPVTFPVKSKIRFIFHGLSQLFAVLENREVYSLGEETTRAMAEFPCKLDQVVDGGIDSSNNMLLFTKEDGLLHFRIDKSSVADRQIKKIACPGNLIKMSAGGAHWLIWTDQGLFTFGSVIYPTNQPTGQTADSVGRLEFFDAMKILDISSGYSHSLVLTDQALYGMGGNINYQCGQPARDKVWGTSIFPKNLAFEDVAGICSGYGQNLIVTKHNKIYGFGYNSVNQCGFVGHENLQEISIFDGSLDLLEVFCGNAHCLVLTQQGLYGWGLGSSSELGEENIRRAVAPIKLSVLDRYQPPTFKALKFRDIAHNYPDLLIELLFARELISDSVFHKSFLPLDLFKLIVDTAALGRIPLGWHRAASKE